MDLKKTHNVYTTIFSLNFQILFFFLSFLLVSRDFRNASSARLRDVCETEN